MAVAVQQAFPEDAGAQGTKPLEVPLLSLDLPQPAVCYLMTMGVLWILCTFVKACAASKRVTASDAIVCRRSYARGLSPLRESQPFPGG